MTVLMMNEHFLRSNRPTSDFTIQAIVREYRESLDFVLVYKNQLIGAAACAAFVYCHGQMERTPTMQKRLEEFLRAVTTRTPRKKGDPISDLQDWFTNPAKQHLGVTRTGRREMYQRILRACYLVLLDRRTTDMTKIEAWFKEQNPSKAEVFYSI